MGESLAGRRLGEHPDEGGDAGEIAATRHPLEEAPRTGVLVSAQAGITLTSTSMCWSPPPKITPRSGTTSAKSAPQVSVM
jgi:hypothetical protein